MTVPAKAAPPKTILAVTAARHACFASDPVTRRAPRLSAGRSGVLDAARIAQAIAGFPIITCDIFDTAVMRRLARPEDVHLATGARALAAGLTSCAPEAFREYRLAAEAAERAEHVQAGDDEIAIADVYRRLQAAGVLTDATAAAHLEFVIEQTVCHPVQPVLAALAARDPGQRLVFLSDTTLPSAWLAAILTNCGYGDRPEVICSAEAHCTKAAGGLFVHVLRTLGCQPRDVIHLGDNPLADVARARQHGIVTLHLPPPHIPPEPSDVGAQAYVMRLAHSLQRSRATLSASGAQPARAAAQSAEATEQLAKMTARPAKATAQPAEGSVQPAEAIPQPAEGSAQPAEATPQPAEATAPPARSALHDPRLLRICLGPLIGFTLFVLAEARRRGIRRIYFMARDGYLPLAIARRLRTRRAEAPQLAYLPCSRQAILLPTLLDDLPQLARLVADGMLGRPLHAALNTLGIAPDTTAGMARAAGQDPDQPVRGTEGQDAVRRLIDAHRETILATLRQRRDAALAYLGECGFLDPGPRMVVDVGWRGSVQKALATLVGATPTDIFGAYLGLWPEALCAGLNPHNAAGYLFSFGHPKPLLDIVHQGYVLFELYFSAPHGPVSHYTEENGRAVPVFAADHEQNERVRRQTVAAIEAASLTAFDEMDAILDGAWPEAIDAASALSEMVPLLTHPSVQDVAALNRVPYIHGLDGAFNVRAVNPVPLRQLVMDTPAALRRIANAPWQAGTLRASLPWPVPDMGFPEFADRVQRLRRLLRFR